MGEWSNRTLVSMTPEQSAAWLRGEDNWLSHIADRQVYDQLKRQQVALRKAFFESAERFAKALKHDSEQSHARLLQLKEAAERGDQRALQLLTAMLGQLIQTAFVDMGPPPQ